ncbi:MAG: type II secretion system protein [Candidatus Gastranaerophilales bacterium]
MKKNFRHYAFTLAEVLITLGILGVVSAMTLPNMISSYQTEVLEKKKSLFDGRIEEAMNQMRFHEKLTGYSNLEDFVEELGKYIKIDIICENDELAECFANSVTTMTNTKETETDLNLGYDIGTATLKESLFSNNLGVIFADGVSAILNYSQDCSWLSPYDGGASRSEAESCLSMIYDLNGRNGKNTVGNDIHTLNAVMDCLILTDSGTCYNQTAFYPTALSYTECEAQKGDLGIDECYYDNDYWAGSVAACGGIEYLPTMNELAEMAGVMYGGTVSAYERLYGTPNDDMLLWLGLNDLATYSGGYAIVSNEEISPTQCYYRSFHTTSTYVDIINDRNTKRLTLCIE